MVVEKNNVKNLSEHTITLENRCKLKVSGVKDVESFDEETVILFTEMGLLTIKGFELHINKLNVESGELIIEGEVNGCAYSETEQNKGSFFARMFK